ncbi:MAG: MFS transporter [Proteobacteria bacterium]|nr:MFS transporter [Pseudomonadota bacterium]MCG2741887.1 MFS transporter [Syntrophaceae bacterium]
MSWRERIVDFFGLRKSIVALLFMAVLVGLGERMAERFLPLYLLALGGGVLSIGFLNGMDNLLSALYSFPGGYLSDRLGYKRALIVFNLIAMTGYVIVILVPHWLAVLIGAAFFLSWSALSLPATMSLVSRSLPLQKRTMGVSLISLVRRIPMALGPVIGGILIGIYGEKTGIRLAFGVALLLGVVSLVFQQVMIADDGNRGKGENRPARLWRFMSPDLRNLLVSDILIRFAEQIPYAFVVIWCIKMNGISAVQFGLLTTIEMVTAMLVYIPVAWLADRTTKKPFVLITFVNFTIFPLFLLFSHSFWMMAVAFVIRGLKEFGEPTRKALIMDLAPEEQKAGMFGLYYLIRDIVVSAAAFAGGFLWQFSPTVNLLAATSCGLLGTIYFAIRGRDLKG